MNVTLKVPSWSAAVGIVVGIVAGIYAVVSFIDGRIEKKLTEEATLQKISQLVRPSLIFDERGAIVFDSGALQLLEPPRVENPTSESDVVKRLPQRIVVTSKRWLATPPLLSVVDSYLVEILVERGTGLEWVYKLGYSGGTGSADFSKCRYRIEVL